MVLLVLFVEIGVKSTTTSSKPYSNILLHNPKLDSLKSFGQHNFALSESFGQS